jgi:hypothetical protein
MVHGPIVIGVGKLVVLLACGINFHNTIPQWACRKRVNLPLYLVCAATS